ncbi:hypothetical protein [Thiogranum longum]
MFSNKALRALLIGSLVLIASPVWAKGLSQSYVDFGYLHAERDEREEFDLDGAHVDAAFGVFEYLSLRAAYTRARTEDFPGDTPDYSEFRFGVRPHYSFSDRGDVFVDLLYFFNELNGNRTSNSDSGGVFAGGLRYHLFDRAELLVAAEHRTGEQDDTYWVVGPVFRLTKNFSLNLKTNQGSDNEEYFAGIRFDF